MLEKRRYDEGKDKEDKMRVKRERISLRQEKNKLRDGGMEVEGTKERNTRGRGRKEGRQRIYWRENMNEEGQEETQRAQRPKERENECGEERETEGTKYKKINKRETECTRER